MLEVFPGTPISRLALPGFLPQFQNLCWFMQTSLDRSLLQNHQSTTELAISLHQI